MYTRTVLADRARVYAEREKRVVEYELNRIEEMLSDGMNGLCVAQIAIEAGFNSEASRRIIARMMAQTPDGL